MTTLYAALRTPSNPQQPSSRACAGAGLIRLCHAEAWAPSPGRQRSREERRNNDLCDLRSHRRDSPFPGGDACSQCTLPALSATG
ncbi:hypothetical protein AAFF_G00334520 [Aldrovandia affinis]|uniref:Uncharacterized protein n=1 Tax=Aldrovandia affinis TaxID=143900 RepID=A0AAD7SL22_9TELE|nr:hypothetical protein AAFF_G00334520 [Aldrovandia affinis]